MGRRILTAIVTVAVLVGGYYAWSRYRAASLVKDGEVATIDMSDAADADSPAKEPAALGAIHPQDAIQGAPVLKTGSQAQGQPPSGSSGDTLPANSPDGVKFAAAGRFLVYRQGNLTWRVNTDTGSTCILFATNDEWRKPIVYNHGCGNS